MQNEEGVLFCPSGESKSTVVCFLESPGRQEDGVRQGGGKGGGERWLDCRSVLKVELIDL